MRVVALTFVAAVLAAPLVAAPADDRFRPLPPRRPPELRLEWVEA